MSTPALPGLPTSLPTLVSLPPRRIFGDAQIQQHLDDALLGASSTSRFAVVAHADLQKFVVVARYHDGPWSVAGYLDKEWAGDLKAGAEVRFEI